MRTDQAELLLELGDVGEARRILAELSTAENQLFARDRVRATLMGALAAHRDGDHASATTMAAVAAEQSLQLSDMRRLAESLVLQSCAALSGGAVGPARELARRAVARFEQSSSGAATAAADLAECRAALDGSDLEGATQALDRARGRAHIAEIPWAVVELERHRGLVLEKQGEHGAAAAAFDKAVRELETRRGLLPPDALRSAFFSLQSPLYRDAIQAQLRVGAIDSAFELATASKGRAMLDMMTVETLLDPVCISELSGLRTRLGAVYSRMHHQSFADADGALLSETCAEAAQLEASIDRLVAANLHVIDAGTQATPSASDLRAALSDDEVFVEYADGADGLHAFVADRRNMRHVALGDHALEIRQRVQKFGIHVGRAARSAPDDRPLDATRANLEALRRLLVDPLALDARAQRIVLSPTPSLQDVPFHAFPTAAGWWADEALIQYAPSALIHAACLRRTGGGTEGACVFALSDAEVPEIAAEGATVAATLGLAADTISDELATLQRFRDSAETASVIHIATHGLSRSESRAGPGLKFADGWLTQFDLHGLRVRADLIVLSACDSGVGRTDSSGDSFGLLRSFLCAGGRSLVSTRWRIDDHATAMWMRSFYRGLGRGLDVGRAFVAAGREVRSMAPHPFLWAPFVLLGHAGVRVSSGIPVSDASAAA